MDSRKKRSQFHVVAKHRSNSLHAVVDIVQKVNPQNHPGLKYQYRWYMKVEKKSDYPDCEVIGQELFRLLYPPQPKTRLVVKSDRYNFREDFIISKEVVGFKSFNDISPETLKNGILNSKIRGLGEVLVLAMLLGENDLRLANIGIDENGNVVKIDGGLLFEKQYKPQELDISLLPQCLKYAKNWLDISEWNETRLRSFINLQSVFLDDNIRDYKDFRREINRGLLKVFFLMEVLLDHFISGYQPMEIERQLISSTVLTNRQSFKVAAFNDSSFKKYIASEEAAEDFIAFIKYLDQFKMTGKNKLIKDRKLIEDMISYFNLIRQGGVNHRALSFFSPNPIKLLTMSDIFKEERACCYRFSGK